MNFDWETKSIGQICSIKRGASPRPIHEWITEEDGIPWVKISDATSYKGNFINQTASKIKNGGHQHSVEVFPGDLILSNSASPGIPRIMGIYACIHDGWLLLRDFKEVKKEFLFYLLEKERSKLIAKGNGSVFTNLKTDILREHEIYLPPINEQKLIADILITLDKKIEINHKNNETLEEIAKSLFKSWFLDFDPVRAKVEDHSTELKKEISDLFPDSFKDTEIGKIPNGWKVKKLGEIIELAYGKPLKESERIKGSFPVFGSNGVVGTHDHYLVQGPGIIIGRKGNPGIVKWSDDNFFPIDTTFYVKPKSDITEMSFLFFALLNQKLSNLSADSAVPGLNRNIAYMNLQIVPSSQIISLYEKQVRELFLRQKINNLENLSLQKLRDSLLPKLISGELRIQDAEKMIDEVGI